MNEIEAAKNAQPDTPGKAREASTTQEVPTTKDGIPLIVNGQRLSEAQIAALREAKERRVVIDAQSRVQREVGGAARETEPTRYLDWELKGRAVDFS